MDKIPSLRHGRPLSLGELDKEVQSYIKALRAAGTPATVPVILAATEGIIMTIKTDICLPGMEDH